MRGLTLRPDDRELFQNIADSEKTAFFMSHQDAFKRMWAEEGSVYWLRFLLAFKRNFETSIMVQPEYQFIFEEDEDERLVSFVFISIHDMFVHSAFNVVHTFISNIFIAIKHLHNLTEPSKVKNPFFTKESREAFRAILGRPDEHDNFPPALIAFALSIYGMFMGAICVILKRWIKEPDLSEDTKKGIDYTYFYWKPPPDWVDEHFWASCFEKHIADTYKDELPKLLLTANIQNIFVENHDMDCFCNCYTENSNIFEMFRSSRDEPDSDYCIQHEGILKPHVMSCNAHSNCYFKVLHSPKCLEPYLCEGSEQCKITCEKNLKAHSKSNPTNSFKKGVVEVFSCKQSNMRHVSTLAQSHNTQIETFLHCKENQTAEIALKFHNEDTEFMMELMHDPEMMNSFNQHKRKEEYKNKLRSKFRQKYCAGPKDFADPDYCANLFESAQKLWIMGVFEENFSKHKVAKPNVDRTNLFESRESAETTVAVGTSCVLTGRIVTPLVKCGGQSSSKEVEKNKVVLGTAVGDEVKPKSKKSKKKKKKNKLCDGSSDKNDAVPLSTTVEKKTESVTKTKECPAVVSEKEGDTLTKDSTNDSILEDKITMVIAKKGNSLILSEKNSTSIKKHESTKRLVKDDNITLECKSKSFTDPSVKEDVDKEGDRLCFATCPPHNQTSNGCSSKMCCPCVLCKKKELSTQNNTSQNNSSVITEKPKKTGKKIELKTTITEKNNSIQGSRQLATEDLNTNSVVSENLLSGVSVKAVEINGTNSCNSQDKSCLDLKEKTVNQNIEQQCINDTNSSDLQTDQNEYAEMARGCVIDSVTNVPDGDMLDNCEATNGLTFETEEEKNVKDFLMLIGVINKPSISKDEPTPNGVEPGANQKSNTRFSDRKLKVCAFCAKKEVTHRTFKRCARCKVENFPQQLYYCSRQCQVDDWEESHMDEHLKRSKK